MSNLTEVQMEAVSEIYKIMCDFDIDFVKCDKNNKFVIANTSFTYESQCLVKRSINSTVLMKENCEPIYYDWILPIPENMMKTSRHCKMFEVMQHLEDSANGMG